MASKLKPYQLVYVTDKVGTITYQYTGQVISMPFPKDNEESCEAVKVRRVPDDPSTMDERIVTALEPVESPTKRRYVHYAKATPLLQQPIKPFCRYFPVDMLRYDNACPVNFRVLNDHGVMYAELNTGEDSLIIARVRPYMQPDWTQGRWASFRWKVEPLKSILIQGK